MRATTVFLLSTLPLLAACGGRESGPDPRASPSAVATREDRARPLPSPVPDIAARVNGQSIPFFRILPLAQAELDAMPESEREARMAEAVRRALDRYIDRELLLQEAIARGVTVDKRAVDWAYDQARAEVPGDEAWARLLADRGMDESAFRSELRVQHTVSALLEEEARARAETETQPPENRQAEAAAALLERLRARARVEIFL